jgi:hypothetical protein
MRRNPERLAWMVMWGAFLTCCLLTIATPVGVNWWLDNATVEQTIRLTRTGTVFILRPGRTSQEADLDLAPAGSIITTQTNAQATLVFVSAEGEALASVDMYGDTKLRVDHAETPRFGRSPLSNRVWLTLESGRIRITTVPETSHALDFQVSSQPDTVTVIDSRANSTSVEATFVQTIVTVREGQSTVRANGEAKTLKKDERVEVLLGAPPSGPLPAERNLIRNGELQDPILPDAWQQDIRPPQNPAEEPGTISFLTTEGRRVVRFTRSGNGWGQVGLSQGVNRDVRGFKSLQLRLDVYITFQDLSRCGQQGTECPVMVRVRYVDDAGAEREWLQGFYYRADPGFGEARCVQCLEPVTEHTQVEPGRWRTYASDNLIELFHAHGAPMAFLRTVEVYASGHRFTSQVAQIQLLASE